MKRLCRASSLPVAEYYLHGEFEPGSAAAKFPIFVKPANLGSSKVGISKVKSIEELAPALKLALEFDRKVIVDEALLAESLNVPS